VDIYLNTDDTNSGDQLEDGKDQVQTSLLIASARQTSHLYFFLEIFFYLKKLFLQVLRRRFQAN
jgi:hypothetical protein